MYITDLEPYREDLKDFDLDDTQKLEFVNAMLRIVEHFVDKAFGKHPIQQSLQETFTQEKRLGILFMNWLYG